MSLWAKWTGKWDDRAELAGDEAMDRELEQTLRNFRLSMHAWSEAAYSRPRTGAAVVRHRTWRLAVGWALGCVLVAGSVGGGVYEYRHRQELARIAAAERETRQQQLAAAERAREAEAELMARIDSDVSQQVPSALEPLAQLMDGDDTQ